MEVKSIERWGADWEQVVTGELLTVEKHPRADRLSLTTVTLGDGGAPLEIVCGATNIAPGQRIPVALPGAVLPGNRRIERAEKMGVVSNGMLCSGEELRLTGDGDGILILPADTPLGVPLADLYGDDVLDVDVKPNRGDALSILGLAREVAAATGRQVRMPEITVPEDGGPATSERLAVDVRDPDLCPRFVGRWVSGVTIGPSPDRVQMRLLAAGQRPVSNVVDASNYVMLELGKPIHTFDAAAVHAGADGRPTIVVRRALAGERLETLDHVERELATDMLLIADARGPDRRRRRHGRRHVRDLRRDDRRRDRVRRLRSREHPPHGAAARPALRGEQPLREGPGVAPGVDRRGPDGPAASPNGPVGRSHRAAWTRRRAIPGPRGSSSARPGSTASWAPTSRPASSAALLARVGIETEPAAADEAVTVALRAGSRGRRCRAPTRRSRRSCRPGAATSSIEADVAEEIARVRGYELVPSVTPHTGMPAYRPSPLEVRELDPRDAGRRGPDRGRHDGAGVAAAPRGVRARARRAVGRRRAAAGWRAHRGHEPAVARPLAAAPQPARQRAGRRGHEPAAGHRRRRRVRDRQGVRAGRRRGPRVVAPRLRDHGRGGAAGLEPRAARRTTSTTRRGSSSSSRPGSDLGSPTYAAETGEAVFHPGRTARATIAGRLEALVGQLHPAIVEAWELRTGAAVIVGEVAIEGLAEGRLAPERAPAVGRHPEVERDLAIVVPESTVAADVEAAIRARGGELLRACRLFDIYRGVPLAADEKSLAYRLRFGAPERTLTEAEIEAAVAAIVAGLPALGGRLRA